MDEGEKNIGSRREFLNENTEVSLNSSIGYRVDIHTYSSELKKRGLYDQSTIDFKITDCSRSINLEFRLHSKEDMKNSLFKLNTIIDVCNSMMDDLLKARKELRKGIAFNKLVEEFEDLEKTKNQKEKDLKEEKFERFIKQKK